MIYESDLLGSDVNVIDQGVEMLCMVGPPRTHRMFLSLLLTCLQFLSLLNRLLVARHTSIHLSCSIHNLSIRLIHHFNVVIFKYPRKSQHEI